MIVYFTDRSLEIVGVAATNSTKGLTISSDKKTESIEDGAVTFDCTIEFDADKRDEADKLRKAGNFVILKDKNGYQLFTIIESSLNTQNREVEIYAEDGGLDLLNEINDGFKGTGTISELITSGILYDTGWEIGRNDIGSSTTKSIEWQSGETNVSALLTIASAFDAEINYSFDISNRKINHKYINIYKKRGDSNVATLTLNNEVDNIIIKQSIADIATGYRATGAIPENGKDPITLNGYSYDDGDFYVKGNKILSRTALNKWSRYFSENGLPNDEGHILKNFSCDATTQADLVTRAIASLKKVYDMNIEYEIDISLLPEDVKVGDTINIIDEKNRVYINSRVLKLETSVSDQMNTATLGEYVTKSYDISSRMLELSKQFQSDSVKQREYTYRTQQLAQSAKEKADDAGTQAEEASKKADEAKSDASNAIDKSTQAFNKATDAINESASALKSANDAKDVAADSLSKVESAQTDLEKAKQNITNLQNDINSTTKTLDDLAAEAEQTKETLDGLSGDLQETKENLEISYAKKTDLSATEASLKAEITKSATELSTNIEKTYAGKTELTETQGKLQSQITQNASGLSSQATQISKLQNDTTDAQTKITAASQVAADAQAKAEEAQTSADNAKTAANDAKTAADTAVANAKSAQDKADEAQTIASNAASRLTSAEKDLSDAKANLTKVTSDVNSTKEQVQAAQDAVTAAQAKVDQATKDANEAQTAAKNATTIANNAKTAASEAQQIADNAKTAADEASKTAQTAKDTADKAQETVAALTKRVSLAETSISQNAESIGLNASKVEEIGDKLKNDYYSKTETDATIKIQADKIDSTVTKVEEINGVVQKTSSKANQLSDKFNWLVKSGTSATDFTLTDRTATLISNYINLNGLVSFGGLNSEAQTKINNAVSDASNAKSAADSALSKANSVDTLLSSWCSANDQTLINGAKIYTGSITAEKLAVDSIKSRNYVANTSGSFLSLQDGSFDSKYLKWNTTGMLTATGGTIGGITINSSGLSTSKNTVGGEWNQGFDINSGGYIKVFSNAISSSYRTTEARLGIDGDSNASLQVKSRNYDGTYEKTTTVTDHGIYFSGAFDASIVPHDDSDYGLWLRGNGGVYTDNMLRVDAQLIANYGWFGKQYFSGDEWIGFYNNVYGTRKGWIGHNGGVNLNINNEAGGNVTINGYKILTWDKMAYMSGTTHSGTGNSVYINYPSGFNGSNCYIASFMVYDSDGNWVEGSTQNINVRLGGSIRIHTNSSSSQRSRPFKIILFKYD